LCQQRDSQSLGGHRRELFELVLDGSRKPNDLSSKLRKRELKLAFKIGRGSNI
jgi:hypothetical protein